MYAVDGKQERKKKGSYWENSIRRRVQHFGYRFNYETRNLDAPRNMCPIPDFITAMVREKLAASGLEGASGVQHQEVKEQVQQEQVKGQVDARERMYAEGCQDAIMTQMTINEYYPGQGISSHIGERLAQWMA